VQASRHWQDGAETARDAPCRSDALGDGWYSCFFPCIVTAPLKFSSYQNDVRS
jgi:hypothetical protein